MCKCIENLVEKDFLERECIYENQDFQDKGYLIRLYKKSGNLIVSSDRVFVINYCPACGEKVRKNAK